MKAYARSGGIDPPFLNLGTRWRVVVIIMPLPFYPQGNSSGYPLEVLNGPQNWPGCIAGEKTLPLLGGLA
jgi:hypothetical protein